MRKNLILDIQKTMKLHNLTSVSIFGNKKNKNKSFSAALALATFLNEQNIPTNIIISNKDGLSFSHELLQESPIDEHFMAISIDNKKITDIESKDYQRSFILINIYGPINAKGFGVLNYVKMDVSGAAEIIFAQIQNYCELRKITMSKEVATYLYMSLLSSTKRFSTNIKKDTFLIAKSLLQKGIDYHNATYQLSKKTPDVLKCQEIILKEMVQTEKSAYSVIPKKLADKYNRQDFIDALGFFKDIGQICVWTLFIERDKKYEVILESNSSYLYDVSKVAKKSGGEGETTQATAYIQKFDISKILADIQSLF